MLRAQRIEDISQEAVTQALNKVPQPTRSFHRPRLPGSHDLVVSAPFVSFIRLTMICDRTQSPPHNPLLCER